MRLVRGAKLCKTPEVGDPVLFYPHANRVGAVAFGTIIESDGDTVTINCQSGTGSFVRDSVRHVDDEVLTTNEHLREFGAWDHAPYFAWLWTTCTRLDAILGQLKEKYEGTNTITTRAKKTREKLEQAVSVVDAEIDAEELEPAAAE